MTKVVVLASRRNQDTSVRLLWREDTESLVLSIGTDGGEDYEVPVAPLHAFDAFENPHLYTGNR